MIYFIIFLLVLYCLYPHTLLRNTQGFSIKRALEDEQSLRQIGKNRGITDCISTVSQIRDLRPKTTTEAYNEIISELRKLQAPM